MTKEKDLSLIKQTVKRLLQTGIVSITFEKVSTGETRTLVGTTNGNIIPTDVQEAMQVRKIPRKVNPDVIVVYDLEKNSWRSFRVDSIVEYKKV
jgi:hypothetical protein